MIQVNDLTFSYPGNKHRVFEGLTLQLSESRIYGLLGKNGMGKSTLLYLIAGLLKPKKGSILIDGLTASRRYPQMLQELYLVPEEYDLPDMTLASTPGSTKTSIHGSAGKHSRSASQTLRCRQKWT